MIRLLMPSNPQQIPYKSITHQPYAYLIRFKEPEYQLKAQDTLQAALGPDYTVALNLADKTPSWLLAIGAKPMKLGLGFARRHSFSLEVDTNTMLKDQKANDMHNMAISLRDQQIRYTGLMIGPSGNIVIQFRDAQSRDAGIPALKKDYPDYQFSPSRATVSLRRSLRRRK